METDCIYRRVSFRGFTGLDSGAELARFYVKKTGPNPNIDVQPHFALTPAIHKRLKLVDFLVQTMQATALVLREFSKPLPSVLDLVGPLIPDQS